MIDEKFEAGREDVGHQVETVHRTCDEPLLDGIGDLLALICSELSALICTDLYTLIFLQGYVGIDLSAWSYLC